MKFFKGPPVGTVRKRFAWLPVRQLLFHGVYIADPMDPVQIPYTPGWNSNHGIPVGVRAARATAGRSGGMVTPVTWATRTVYDHWAWLEWVVERRSTSRSAEDFADWQPYYLPRQWSLFYEYD